jgi:putative transposase
LEPRPIWSWPLPRCALATLENGQELLVHSDLGSQYQHNSWRTHSWRTPAVMENFFGHLKEEFFHGVRFLNIDALASALHEYIRW